MKLNVIRIAVLIALMFALGQVPLVGVAGKALNPAAGAGIIGVEIWQPDGWQKVGDASFSLFHQKSQMAIPQPRSHADSIRLRLTQSGGKAAYMDALLLNGHPPTSLSGLASPKAQAKLMKQDHDLLDITNSRFEAEFVSVGSELNLDLTAKIVPPKISPVPLRYPEANSRLPLGEARFFYKIRPTKKGTEDLTALMTNPAAIREFSNTGSGHPAGVLMGWVEADSQHLLLTFDFTQDNTEDGDDDYMEVQIKTPRGVKPYRITQSRQQHGEVHFIATPRAAYEHKVYRFKIPFSDLALAPGDPIELAVAAYGTVSAPFNSPSLAFDSVHRRYLMAYTAYNLDTDVVEIRGLFVDADGQALGSEFVINNEASETSNTMLRVGFHPRNQTYFVVWEQWVYEEEVINLQLQILDADGNTRSPQRRIWTSENHQLYVDLAFGNRTNGFLLAWSETAVSNESWSLHSLILDGDGQALADTKTVFTGVLDEQVLPRICTDNKHGRFLVTFVDYQPGLYKAGLARGGAVHPDDPEPSPDYYDVLGQLVSYAGRLIGPPVPLAATERLEIFHQAVFNPYQNQYYLVWMEFEDSVEYFLSDATLNSRLFDHDLTPAGPTKTLGEKTDMWFYKPFAVAFDALRNRYLTVWNHATGGIRARPALALPSKPGLMSTPGSQSVLTPAFDEKPFLARLYGQYANVLGTPGEPVILAESENFMALPELAANPFCGNFLCGFNQGLMFDARIAEKKPRPDLAPGYLLIGDPCVPVPEVSTGPIVEVGRDDLQLEGAVLVADGGLVGERGFCWGKTPAPAIEGDHLAVGSGTGIFSARILGLTPRDSYHVRAYAKYSQGIAYGNDLLVLIHPQYRVEFKTEGQGQLQGEQNQLVYEGDDCSPVGFVPAAGWYFKGWQNLRTGDDAQANPLVLKGIGSAMTPTAQFLPVNLTVWAKTAQGWVLQIPYNLILVELPGLSGDQPDQIVLQRSRGQGEFVTIARFTTRSQIQHADAGIEKGQAYRYRLILLDQRGQEIGRSLEVAPQ
jgi:hypothetical protein